jgi:hypothetical protein
MLQENKIVEVQSGSIKAITIKDAGKLGHVITLQDIFAKDFENFYAAHAEIKASLAIGGESSGLSISFDGRSMEASVSDPNVLAQINASANKVLKGFATGHILKKNGIERGEYQVFVVKTLDPSILEE